MSILSNLLFYLVGMWLHKLIFILDVRPCAWLHVNASSCTKNVFCFANPPSHTNFAAPNTNIV